jgi:hypothetical protein
VKRGLSLRTKRRVTQIDGILGVAVKVGTRRKPRRGYAVDHCPVAQHGQIEAVAVERDELRARSTAGLVPKKRTPALVGAGVIRRKGLGAGGTPIRH